MIGGRPAAVGEDRRGVVRIAVNPVNEANHRDQPSARIQELVDAVSGLEAERSAQDEVFRWVAGHGQFRHGHNGTVSVASLIHSVADELDIAGEVANGWIDLGQADSESAHRRSQPSYRIGEICSVSLSPNVGTRAYGPLPIPFDGPREHTAWAG